jgi:poly-gamma-glutamate synthesis protein (capsule biosynthesis protein)
LAARTSWGGLTGEPWEGPAIFVMMAHHNSVSEGGHGETPTKFVVDFAKKAIDAGADMYIGHGWHTALGIEIYKNKPIVYGLGNFFWQSSFIERKPADQFESYGYDMDELTTLHPAIGNLHPAGNEHWAWSAVYQFTFENKKVTEIRMHPIEMGMDFSKEKPVVNRQIGSGPHPYLDGSPRMAHGASAQKILERMQRVCAQWGTKLDIRDGVGIVRVSA